MKIDLIKDSYLNWIRENTHFSNVLNSAVEISTPFIDSLNENIKIYIEPSSNNIKISDDGYTIWSLESLGISFRKGSHREKMLFSVVDRHSVSINIETKELFINTDKDHLGKAIHTLIQAVLTVSDLLKIDKKNIKNLFLEEVNAYFKSNAEIFDYFPDFEIQGKSKLTHRFDYLMTVKDRKKKLVRVVNHLDKVQLERILLSWEDTSKQRMTKYQENLGMVAIINDSDRKIQSNFEEAFIQYGIEPVGFSNKEEVNRSLSLTG